VLICVSTFDEHMDFAPSMTQSSPPDAPAGTADHPAPLAQAALPSTSCADQPLPSHAAPVPAAGQQQLEIEEGSSDIMNYRKRQRKRWEAQQQLQQEASAAAAGDEGEEARKTSRTSLTSSPAARPGCVVCASSVAAAPSEAKA